MQSYTASQLFISNSTIKIALAHKVVHTRLLLDTFVYKIK